MGIENMNFGRGDNCGMPSADEFRWRVGLETDEFETKYYPNGRTSDSSASEIGDQDLGQTPVVETASPDNKMPSNGTIDFRMSTQGRIPNIGDHLRVEARWRSRMDII